MIRGIFILVFSPLTVSCSSFDDDSLTIESSSLTTTCECNDANIAVYGEMIDIPEMMIEIKSGDPEKEAELRAEYKKRRDKMWEFDLFCRPIYDQHGFGCAETNLEFFDLGERYSNLAEMTGW